MLVLPFHCRIDHYQIINTVKKVMDRSNKSEIFFKYIYKHMHLHV